jgi:hypothetical protein
VLLDHVEVVQEPFAGRPDVDVALGRVGEPVVGLVEDPARLVKPLQQPVAGMGRAGRQPLVLRDRARPLGEELGAEQLAADRTREELVESGPGARAIEAASEDGRQRDAEDGDSRAAVRRAGSAS